MKKLLFAAVCLAMTTSVFAQEKGLESRDYVEVRGNATKMVEPDRIVVSVELSEAESKGKVTMNMLETQFGTALQQAGVETKDVVMTGQSSAADKRKGAFLFKNYNVTLKSTQNVNSLFGALEENQIKTASVTKAWVSNQKEIIDSLKVEAVIDAQKNAKLIAGAIKQRIGAAIQIIDNNYNMPLEENFFRAKSAAIAADSFNSSPLEDVGFRKITITQSITVRFFLW